MKENLETCMRIKCEHCKRYEKCFKKELMLERQNTEKKEGGAGGQVLR